MTIDIDVVSRFELFTKEQLQKLFDERGTNRPLRGTVVREYSKRMDTGTWKPRLKSELPILIDKSGKLRGGQHRIAAAIKSKKITFEFPVARDVSEDDVTNQDAGSNRTFSDRAVMFHGLGSYPKISVNKLSAIGRLIVEAKGNKALPESVADEVSDKSQALSALDSHLSKDGRLIKSAPLLAACAFAYEIMDNNLWVESIIRIDQGIDVVANSPIHKLRILTDKASATRRQNELFLKALGALKSVHKNENVSYLTANKKHLENW